MSLLTTFGGYLFATTFLLGWVGVTFIAEWWWISVVYNRFPVLHSKDSQSARPPSQEYSQLSSDERPSPRPAGILQRWERFCQEEWRDWSEFIRMPIFMSRAIVI